MVVARCGPRKTTTKEQFFPQSPMDEKHGRGRGGALAKLHTETRVLHLLVHRNRNQHRMQTWWPALRALHARVRRLELTPSPKIARRVLSAAQACFWGGRSLLAGGQWATLGFAIVAVVARVWAVVGQYLDEAASQVLAPRGGAKAADAVVAEPLAPLGSAAPMGPMGPMRPMSAAGPSGGPSGGPKKPKMAPPVPRARKKTKAKAKSTMDSIFG